jgi:cytochrome b6-f complex iron-sulfur subunit
MEARDVLLIAVPVILGLAVLLVVATTVSRQRSSTGSLGREAKKADRSASTDVVPTADLDEEARVRFAETKSSLEPAGKTPVVSAAGGLIRFGDAPADPEALGVTRRQFFNRGILASQSLVLGSFSLAVIGFLWPSRTGGFGGEVKVGEKLEDVIEAINEKKTPFYVPEARSYLALYPKAALPKAKAVYKDPVLSGMEKGVVALFQKCPHLGCRVPWCATSQWFECPCHGSKYNRVGEKKGGPAPRGMDRWPVDVGSDGTITINTGGSAVQGPAIGTNTTGQEAEGPNCV